MNTKKIGKGNTTKILVFLMSCLGLVGVMAFDKLYLGVEVLAEGWPKFSADYIIRSIVISISTLTMLWSLTNGNSPNLILDEKNGVPFERLSILGVISASVVFLFLFIFNPSSFNILSMEDGYRVGISYLAFRELYCLCYFFCKNS